MMKLFLFLLLAFLAVGGFFWLTADHGPKYKNPVVVTGSNVSIHTGVEPGSPVIAVADKGDTLELAAADSPAFFAVSLDAKGSRLPGGVKRGYIARRFVAVPAATLARAKAGRLNPAPVIPAEAPAHLRDKR